MLYKEDAETHPGNEFTRNSSGNACPQSSQLAEPMWTDLWPKRVTLVRASHLCF